MEKTKKIVESLKTPPTNPTRESPLQEKEKDLLDAQDKNVDVVDETLAKNSTPGRDHPIVVIRGNIVERINRKEAM